MKNQDQTHINRTGLHSVKLETPNINIDMNITIARPVLIEEVYDLFMCILEVIVNEEGQSNE